MESSDLPLQKNNGNLSGIAKRAERLGLSGLRAEARGLEAEAAHAYDGLANYRGILVRHKLTLLRFAGAGLLTALLISLLQTPFYRARTSLEIQDINDNFMDLKSVEPTDSSGDYNSAESYVETQIKILQSESLLERVIDKLNMQEAPPSTFGARVARMLRWSRASRSPRKEELVQLAEHNLTVSAPGHTHVLEVLYESPDPRLAADFANTLVSEFVGQSQEMRWQSTQRTAEWLTNHLDEMKVKLEQSEAQLQNYAQVSGLTLSREGDNVAEIRLKELQDEVSKAQADRVAKQAKFEESKREPVNSLPDTLDDPTLRDYREKLTDLQRQLVELSITLTPEHYKVQRVQAQIAKLQSAVDTEHSNILRRVGNEYAAALRRERLLSAAQAEQEKTVADQSGRTIRYNTLKRDVDSNRQLYESLLQRVKQASLAAAMRAGNVLVVDPAKPPLHPYKPDLPKNSALGLLSGVFLGLGFVLFRERFDRRICAPGDTLAYLNLPELGAIPLARLPVSRQISNGVKVRTARALSSGRALKTPASDCPELATWQRKPSLLAECVRTALTSILLTSQNGDHPRVVVLTSPCPGDGKTTVASNLSIAMAEIRQNVLLIDGDLRRPRLHEVFGVPNEWGLGDVLRATTPLESIPITHLVCKTKISGLHLLPGGKDTIAASSLLYSPRMSWLLRRVRREFDMVLVDAPPMIHLADARVLGRLADGIILVVRAGQTTFENAIFACQRFAEDGTHVLGTILNRWDPKSSGRYGYGSYDDYEPYAAH